MLWQDHLRLSLFEPNRRSWGSLGEVCERWRLGVEGERHRDPDPYPNTGFERRATMYEIQGSDRDRTWSRSLWSLLDSAPVWWEEGIDSYSAEKPASAELKLWKWPRENCKSPPDRRPDPREPRRPSRNPSLLVLGKGRLKGPNPWPETRAELGRPLNSPSAIFTFHPSNGQDMAVNCGNSAVTSTKRQI